MNEITVADVLRKYGAEAFSMLGALIGLSFVEKLTIITAAVALLAGLAFGVLGAPIVAHYIDPPAAIRDYVVAGCALVLAIVGFVLAGTVHAVARSVKDWAPEFVRKLIDRKAGG